MKLSDDNYQSLPIMYTITNEDGNKYIKLIHCIVDLPEKEIPEWLSPTAFMIRQVYSPENPRVTVTELSSIPCNNVESAKFIDSTHEHIRVIEKLNG